MIYGEPTKDEDGLRWVKTTTDGGRKVYVQLNKVKIEKIEGDENTIMGLPIKKIKAYLGNLNF